VIDWIHPPLPDRVIPVTRNDISRSDYSTETLQSDTTDSESAILIQYSTISYYQRLRNEIHAHYVAALCPTRQVSKLPRHRILLLDIR